VVRPREDKEKLEFYVPTKLANAFRDLANKKTSNPLHPCSSYGAISQEGEEMVRSWIIAHTQNYTQTLVPNIVNPTPKVFKVYLQIKAYMKEKLGDVPHTIAKRHIFDAITAIRGLDPRTIKKWFDLFDQNKCIKFIAGEIWELT